MSGPYRDPRPGVFLLRGDKTVALRRGSGIDYDSTSGIVTVQIAVFDDLASAYKFQPAASSSRKACW
jgi:hypothetical protein